MRLCGEKRSIDIISFVGTAKQAVPKQWALTSLGAKKKPELGLSNTVVLARYYDRHIKCRMSPHTQK